ncbi:MAG: SDR family oxidoreductase [Acidimicrobiales bacterium]|jgi:ketoreductase RED2
MPNSLEGKVALVTGSTSGIGAATALALAGEGAAIAINSVKSVTEGEALAAKLDGSTYIQADVADPQQAQHLIDEVVSRLGHLDILVNNAGTTVVIPHRDIEAATPEIWRRIYEVNVIAAWQLSVAAMPHLRASGDGSIVNVSSLAGERPTMGSSSIPYAASKAAMSHMTRLLANVAAPEVRVNAVAPGLVDTPWTAEWHEKRALVEMGAPLRRSGKPEDVAHVIIGLVNSKYVTGQVVIIDGGMHLL